MASNSTYEIGAERAVAVASRRSKAARVAEAVRGGLSRVAIDPRMVVPAAVVVVLLVGAFVTCWIKASRMIDERLASGAVDARAGVYAAPLVVRAGQPLAREDLLAYLQQLGYSSDPNARGAAGQFAVDGDAVAIEPTEGSMYEAVRVEFSGERGVRRVVDPRSGKAIELATLEPLMLSAGGAKQKRIPVAYDSIPERLRGAILATEDRRFWDHHGVDYRGLARAARENFDDGDVVQGGSTLTQQVVKNLFLTPERSYTRKVKEAFIAYVLESKLSKPQIFEVYCNEIYLGQSGTYAVHGVGAAAQLFFGKDLSALSLDETALLAGIINSPNSNSPYRHPDRAKTRRDLVLDMMAANGVVTAQEADAAKAEPIRVAPIARDAAWLDAPYFDDYVRDFLDEATAGAESGRQRVDTTIDVNLQRAASAVVESQLARLDAVLAKGKNGVPPGTVQAALVALDPRTGGVLAMVGGRDYATSQLNRATDAMRQPGSVFKPFVYATALASRRFTAATPVLDAPQKFAYGRREVYEPGNFGESYSNKEIPLRLGLRYSKNVVTVSVAMQTGLSEIAATAERAGLPRPDPYPAMALGTSEATPLEVAGAYTCFVDGGRAVEPTPVSSSGDVRVPRANARQVLSPQVAYVMTDMLEDVVARGTGAGVRARGVKGAVAGKTGTSRDGWFAGYTPNLVCVVWVGFDDNRQLGLTGAESALPIWADFVKQAVAFRPDLGGASFAVPAGITMAKVCDESGLIAGEFCPSSHDEIFVAGTQPAAPCTTHTGPSLDEMVPLFDEDGNFVGYGPPSPDADRDTASEPTPLEPDRPGEDGDEVDDSHAANANRRAGPGSRHARGEQLPPGMVALPPDDDDDEGDEDATPHR
jgi:penicillin-binding protein 1B